MSGGRICTLFLVLSVTFAVPTRANASFWSVAAWAGDYLLGRGIDFLWDKATGKPDIRKINERLRVVEETVSAADSQLGESVRKLRESIRETTTEREYYRMAVATLSDVNKRVSVLEKRVSNNEEAIRKLNQRMDAAEQKLREVGQQSAGGRPARTPPSRAELLDAAGIMIELALLTIEAESYQKSGALEEAAATATTMLKKIDRFDSNLIDNGDEKKRFLIRGMYKIRAESYYTLEVYELAARDLSRVISFSSTPQQRAYGHNLRGHARYRQGDMVAAEADFAHAAFLVPIMDSYSDNVEMARSQLGSSRSGTVATKAGDIFVRNHTSVPVVFKIRYYVNAIGETVHVNTRWTLDAGQESHLVTNGRRIRASRCHFTVSAGGKDHQYKNDHIASDGKLRITIDPEDLD